MIPLGVLASRRSSGPSGWDYSVDFTTASPGVLDDWTRRWDIQGSWGVTASGLARILGGSNDAREALTLDALDGAPDVEILMFMRTSGTLGGGTRRQLGVAALAEQKSAGSETGSFAVMSSTGLRVGRYIDGSLNDQATDTTISLTTHTRYGYRLRAADGILSARAWKPDSESEPETWGLTVTANTSGPHWGIFTLQPDANRFITEFHASIL